MRLTLRTLLAYVDDILEAPQAKEIGEKIAESGFATALMNRIRDVMRRRRLTSPDLEGPGSGLDPNMVAEYLDNVLPPEKVPDVEKVCLESDVHLAEVAACHQILTAAQVEPVQILHESREHMYALGPVGKSASGLTEDLMPRSTPISEPQPAVPSNGHPDAAIAAAASAASESDDAKTLPEFLRRPPLWKRAMPYVAVGLIAVGWLGLLNYESLRNLATGQPSAAVQDDESLDGQLAAHRNDRGDAARSGRIAAGGPADVTDRADDAPPFDAGPIDPLPPADEAIGERGELDAPPPGELDLPPIPMKAATVPADDRPESEPADEVAANAAAGQAKPVDAPQPAAVPLPPGPVLQYSGAGGVLLRFDDAVEDWMVMAPRAILHPGEEFAAPEPFDSEINIGGALARATLMGGSRIRILAPTEAADTGFAIEQGRVAFEPLKAAPPADEKQAAPKSVVLAVGVRDELWRVELLSSDTVCGIEIVPVQPDQPDQNLGRNTFVGAIFVVSGSVRLIDGTGQVQQFEGPGWRSLTPADPGEENDALAAGPPLLQIPEWLDPVARKSSARTAVRSAKLFEKEFDADRPLSENMHPLIKDNRPFISELAVKCLALVSDHSALAAALVSPHEESRRAAVTGLRNWLAQDESNGELLKQALEKRFAPDETDIVYRLLWGFNEQDATNRATSEQLVAWLDHNNLIVRELAFYHIYRLTGIKYDYHPLRSPTQRRASIFRWEQRVASEGALIAPPKGE